MQLDYLVLGVVVKHCERLENTYHWLEPMKC